MSTEAYDYTGSQVCNLAWSKNVNEIVSTHGYSQNQIVIWKYPSMTKLTTLTGHSTRVLYLATSPDGQTVVTGAGKQLHLALCTCSCQPPGTLSSLSFQMLSRKLLIYELLECVHIFTCLQMSGSA